ncbi:MAG: O-antigen ligase family protein [Xanthobacteraceae bacterium]
MTAAPIASAPARFALSAERLRLGILWLAGFSGGIVVIEPAPYEFIILLALAAFAPTLRIRATHVPLLVLLTIAVIAYSIGVVPVANREGTVKWTIVTCFMAVTAIFIMLALAENTQGRLNALLAGYIAGGVVVGLIGILAWFHVIPGTDIFLINGRARSTFKDANVFGPFLILPAMIVLMRFLTGTYRVLLINLATLGILCLALLLSFSRGAWGHFVVSVVLLVALCFATASTNRERARVATFAIIGVGAAAVLLALILSIDAVGSLFQERASLVQSYDAGPQGRFGRHLAGFLLMLDFPFGIGPMQFTQYFTEDPHNSFLDAFVAGGWLGGITHFLLMLVTLAFGFREVFRRAPWQRTYIAVYATFAAEVGESYIIDVQHWRHFYLLIGVIWGLTALRKTQSRAVAHVGGGLYIAPPQRSVAQPG